MIANQNVLKMCDTSFLSLHLKKQQLPQGNKQKHKDDKSFQEIFTQEQTEINEEINKDVVSSTYDNALDTMPSMQTNVMLKIKHK